MLAESPVISGKAPYLRHFGLVENPFRITPNPRYTYATPSMREALAHSRHAVDDALGLACVSGEIGTGKTTLKGIVRDDAREDGHAVADLYRVPGDTKQTESKIYAGICSELEISAPRSAEKALKAIQDRAIAMYASGKTLVVCIDDAHRLRSPGLAVLKSLLNLQGAEAQLVQVILFGQLPEMADVLTADKAIHSRLAVHTRLNPLAQPDVANMIEHRLLQAGCERSFFSAEAVDMLYRRSMGIPRVICTIADRASTFAFDVHAKRVEKVHVSTAADALLHENQI
jgi:general secretion pathway protein A